MMTCHRTGHGRHGIHTPATQLGVLNDLELTNQTKPPDKTRQGKKVLDLQLPTALDRVLLGLEWTNLDPASVTGTCTLPRTSYFDR